jgi:hypothetical protein
MRLGLPKSELNKFLLGSYPADDAAGLKVYLVTPEYLFGTWLKAIAAGVETYLTETIMLGVELGVTSMEHINGYARLYLGDALQSEHAQRRAKDLLAAITKRRKLVFASE